MPSPPRRTTRPDWRRTEGEEIRDLSFPLPLNQLLAMAGLHLAEFERLRNAEPALDAWRIRAATLVVAATAGLMVWAEASLLGSHAPLAMGLCAVAISACVGAYSQRWPQTRRVLMGIAALAIAAACCCEMRLLGIALSGLILWAVFLADDDRTAESRSNP